MSGTITESVLEDSIGSISSLRAIRSPSKAHSSLISKTYKQASNLFLTRRLPEALQVLEPIITPPKRDEDEEQPDEAEARDPAPIANASKSVRVKVWNLYITLLNAIIELGPEEGKGQFGRSEWRALAAKARDGSVWEEVVRDGYHGREGRVDADVISNLATLLLSHSSSQTLNQQRLETYLATSGEYTFDISDRFETSSQISSDFHPNPARASGTNTPRDLNSRLKVIELYTLHVLPRNDEWDYAQEFVSMSEILDDERRELFLQTLQSLRDQRQEDIDREVEIQRSRQQEMERERERRTMEERRLADTPVQEEQQRQDPDNKKLHKRSDSEKDYGIEDPQPSNKPQRPNLPQTSSRRNVQAGGAKFSRRPPGPKRPPDGLYKRSITVMQAFQHLFSRTARSMSDSPLILVRMLIFLVALLIALGRRDSREWLTRITSTGWERLKRNFG